MTNEVIAEFFSALSKLMDLHGEDSFKSKSYSIAAYNIEQLPLPLTSMSDDEIRAAKGIGASTALKIREILDTGQLQQLTDIIARTPNGVLEIMQIKGLGPKKVRTIWQEMGIESVGELEYACNENRLAAYKGFGEKTQQAVLQNIHFLEAGKGFRLWAETEQAALAWQEKLTQSFRQNRFALCGAFARQMEVVSKIEILTDLQHDVLPRIWASAAGVTFAASEDKSILTVNFASGQDVVFYFTESARFGAELFRRNCSEQFLQAFETQYVISENAESEEAVFSANKIHPIPAPMREDADVLRRAALAPLPALIQKEDIRGLIHCHSRWSDGQNSVAEMAAACMEKSWEYMLITDHSQSAYYAGGLKPQAIAEQHAEVDALNNTLNGFRIFKGIESDILNDGGLDYSSDVLRTFDLVIASVHSNLRMSEEKAMQRVIAAIENPFTSILGHPTGRLLLSREGYPLDHKKIIDACAANDVVLEINAHPRRLDLDWRHIDYALNKGVLLSVNPDAHAVSGLDDVYYGCKIAQKGGLTKEANLSSFSRADMEKFVERQHRKR